MTTLSYRSTTLPVRFPGRRFQLWRYTVGHARLLLVSTKDDVHRTRCEILFGNVARMDLPVLMDDVEVDAVGNADAPGHVLQPGAREMRERTVYRVRGNGFVGYVVAGVAVHGEDDGEYYAPSSLLDEPGV